MACNYDSLNELIFLLICDSNKDNSPSITLINFIKIIYHLLLLLYCIYDLIVVVVVVGDDDTFSLAYIHNQNIYNDLYKNY